MGESRRVWATKCNFGFWDGGGAAGMIKRKHSRAEIAAKLAQANDLVAQGKLQSEIAQTLGVSVMTLHRWRKSPAAPIRNRECRSRLSNSNKSSVKTNELATSNWKTCGCVGSSPICCWKKCGWRRLFKVKDPRTLDRDGHPGEVSGVAQFFRRTRPGAVIGRPSSSVGARV